MALHSFKSSTTFAILVSVSCLLSLFPFTTEGLQYNGETINRVLIGGVFTCLDRSIAVAKTFDVVPQAPVDLVCRGDGGAETVLESALTDVAGVYRFDLSLLNNRNYSLFDPSTCKLRFTIPANSACTLSNLDGIFETLNRLVVSTAGLVNALQPILGIMIGTAGQYI